MWIERTGYYAKPNRAGEVLEHRRRASACRVALGLPAGAISRRQGGDGPDVTWECHFETRERHEADLAARAGSPEFEAIRARMRELIERFERHIEIRDDVSPLANGIVGRGIAGQAIAPRELTLRSGHHGLKGYLQLPPGAPPFPLMVINHGSGIDQGTLDVSRPGTASLLASWGVASFLLHRHGYGNSEGPGWRSEVTDAPGTPDYDAQLAARLDRESEDVLRALDLVASLPEIRADHIGVLGSSFGGVNTLLAAAKTDRFRCAVEFAGAAMNWDFAPGLRQLMIAAARRGTCPIFFIQAANDYSIRPTLELSEALVGSDRVVESKLYPVFGITPHEGHLLERDGPHIWGPDVRRFLEHHL